MNRMIQLKQTTPVFLVVLLLCFGVLQGVQAVVPPPDGGYPGFNTAEGQKALFGLTTGVANTAVGWFSLFSNTEGSYNTGVGAGTLLFNIGDQTTGEGTQNTAIGAAALLSNTTGVHNTGIGVEALFSNTTGYYNTATGRGALEDNSTGSSNTATGLGALARNTIGESNTASGVFALTFNTTGEGNTANGYGALLSNSAGVFNTANGFRALYSNTIGSGNTALGYTAGSNLTTGGDNICIANDGVAGDAAVIRIGRSFITATYIAGISGKTASGGAAVFVNSEGKLGTSTSSARFKDDIKPMGRASEGLLALKPVTFRYKKEIDSRGIPQFGLVAEDVEAVNPDLVVRDKEGKVNTVRYDAVNAMLLNEFLKEHRKNEEQQAIIAELKKAIARLTARDEEQAAQIQKVSTQLEASKPAPQLVNNP